MFGKDDTPEGSPLGGGDGIGRKYELLSTEFGNWRRGQKILMISHLFSLKQFVKAYS